MTTGKIIALTRWTFVGKVMSLVFKMLSRFVIAFLPRSSSVQLLSHVRLLVTPWIAARQSSLSFIISWSLLKVMSIESVMLSNHPILCHPLLLLPSIFPSIRVFFQWVSSSYQVAKVLGVSASSSVLPMNIQDWFPLGLTGLISLQSKGLSRVFSNTAVWKHLFFGTQPFL